MSLSRCAMFKPTQKVCTQFVTDQAVWINWYVLSITEIVIKGQVKMF